MSTLSAQLSSQHVEDADDLEWFHLLVGDWQLVADLGFADLVLWVADSRAPHAFQVVAHCRPTTGSTMYLDDIVGRAPGPRESALLDAVLERGGRVRAEDVGLASGPLEGAEAYPVVRRGRTLGVISVHSHGESMALGSPLEQNYRRSARALLTMVAAGDYPDLSEPSGVRRGDPRVGDGLLVLDREGRVTFGSPNGLSLLHRLGHTGNINGEYLSEIVAARIEQLRPVDETLPLVLTGRAPWRSEIEAGRVAVSLRAIPLTRNGRRVGAIILARDVSELRRRERDLLSRDATIREMHHRVKNNLQTVAALLRLQSRRTTSTEAIDALSEATRRVSTIAIVHDTLSQGIGPDVDFDEIVDKSLRLTPELASPTLHITVRREGGFGSIATVHATSLALALTELVTNAIEHGFPVDPDGPEVSGTLWVRPERDENRLRIIVADDGVGIPEGKGPGTGLGTQIVRTLVTTDLGGTITWQPREGGGTEVVVDVPLTDE